MIITRYQARLFSGASLPDPKQWGGDGKGKEDKRKSREDKGGEGRRKEGREREGWIVPQYKFLDPHMSLARH
jgi:hypothetical protein